MSRVGGKSNQIEPLRLGPGLFASKLMESNRFDISKFVLILLSRTLTVLSSVHDLSILQVTGTLIW